MPDTVNPQITDAVAQTNVKVLGEAPAYAMSALYQQLAHAVGVLYENAVSSQQQQNTLALAASNQGIMQIYSADTAAEGAAQEHLERSSSPAALQARLLQTAASTQSAFATPSGAATAQIEAALKLANDSVLGGAADVAYAVRASADAMAAALQAVGKASHDNLMRTLQMAATAACLEAMLRNPDKAAEYEQALQAIKRLA